MGIEVLYNSRHQAISRFGEIYVHVAKIKGLPDWRIGGFTN
jgi:ABC-type dipeptide/oligopeptide/nickel transport system permease component